MNTIYNDGDNALFAVPYDGDKDRLSSISQQLQASTESPTPDTADTAGPAPRITNRFASIPAGLLRRLTLSGGEAAEAIRTRRDELYRNEFPRLEPRYAQKCAACGSEFDDDVKECTACGSDSLHAPDPEAKREATRLFESVNPAGQSLRDLAKRCEEDQWTTGVSAIVIQHQYYQATTGDLYREGEIYREEPTALHRADPLALHPVVDESGQPGGHWWVCPIHREAHTDGPGRCEQCGAERRPVHFVEQERGNDYTYYLRDEVITWAYPHPRLHGLDGLAPAAHIWLKQAILQMMDRYAGAFYDSSSDRLPNQFMILHTSNPDHWEAELAKARDENDDYSSPIFTNQYSPQDSATPEVDVIDAMPDELLGQSEATKSQFKSDIRQAFGISDIHDSDLEDASGLNNEGLQLEVTDRSLASQMHDYREGWLDTLMKRLGFDGWRISFLPERDVDAGELKSNLEAAALVKQAGGDAEIVDGRLEVSDFEVDLDDSDDPPSLQGSPNLPGVGSPIPDAGGGGGPAALQAEVDTLERAAFELVAPAAIERKAGPTYASEEDVPPNVRNRIRKAVRTHDFSPVESMSSPRLQDIFETRLTQPQGWSINSLSQHLQSEGLAADRAEAIARTEATAILNRAREDAVADLKADLDETVLHYWDGPQDADTSPMCAWLKGGDDLVDGDVATGFEGTHPEFGGDPVSMDKLRQLQREAIDLFSDQESGSGAVRDHILHVNERHTHRSILASEVSN